MRILALDIGVGTRDVLLYDSGRTLENCTRMVLPSPTRLLAYRVEEATYSGRDLFITGHTVGGGPFSRSVKRVLAAGRKVYMTPAAALSIRNNLEDVASLGIEIVNSPPPGFSGITVTADELDLQALANFLARSGEDMSRLDGVAVAVQDHGTYASGESNRKTRLRYMRERLEADPRPTALAMLSGEVSDAFPRLASAARRAGEQFPSCRILVMDTAPAAVAGCLADPLVASRAPGNILLVNAGNGHTLACILSEGCVVGLLEHHTHRLDPGAFADYLRLFCDGGARDEDPFMAEGHGLFYLEEAPGWRNLDLIAVTGPNRGLLKEAGLDGYFPAPGGDMMMTGPLGLVRAFMEHKG
ncbi:MAG: DUF1786 family protein [Actinomycetota bacterium]|nr:DUF1786 family protein [Actinomycetota bacterium]MDI7252616.1 DUF1786 family protein [Actinomycetota bacterium]